ncbi:MAG: endopeptidase La [Erysipelotrichaceae bacterium]|nr:endopeptidase La [Erysipelotrichaceae bacterium]
MVNKNTAKRYELPLIITRNQVYFPFNQSDDLDAGRPATVEAIKYANNSDDKLLIVATQKVFTVNNPSMNDIYEVGVLARLTKVRERPHHITVQLEPLARVFINELDESGPFIIADATVTFHEPLDPDANPERLKNALFDFFNDKLELTRRLHIDLDALKAADMNLEELIYFLANKTLNSTEQRMAVLAENSLERRIDILLKFLEDDVANDAVGAITQIVRNRPQSGEGLDEVERDGLPLEDDEDEDEDEEFDTGEEILAQLKKRYFPKNFVTRIKKEAKKMGRVEPSERSRIIEYLDWLMKLPYDQETIDNLDLENVRKVLDKDHFGLEEPKKRIVEFMAVKRLAKENRATVLCFYGPPGTGKTSLATSIATAMGRKLVKASLGGVDDESKLRGFLRTYVGAQPGIIISSMRKAGTINPIFVLDEVDKLGKSNRGDPSSALLEILDPEQNKGFIDHYIDEPYDLSKVVFIATANYYWDIPRPLRDRMEMIELKGYTEEEKVQIAEKHLIPNGIESHGLKGYDIKFTDEALRFIIGGYTWEAGVRMLNQKISAIFRKLSVEVLSDVESNFTITPEEVQKHLGKPRNFFTKKEPEPIVGVVTGISVAGNIGDIMKIEVTTFKGKGVVNVTGNLEKMLKESGEIAASHVRSYAEKYGINPDVFLDTDINVHFPQASTKDGNSAGVAMTIGIISVLTDRKINPNVAMTGEVTLTGRVLAIGGLYEKILGCIRAGIETVLFPEENVVDLDEIPQEVKDKVKLVPIKNIDEAVAIALLPKKVKKIATA